MWTHWVTGNIKYFMLVSPSFRDARWFPGGLHLADSAKEDVSLVARLTPASQRELDGASGVRLQIDDIDTPRMVLHVVQLPQWPPAFRWDRLERRPPSWSGYCDPTLSLALQECEQSVGRAELALAQGRLSGCLASLAGFTASVNK